MSLFRVLKARKAKHGFQSFVAVSNFQALAEAQRVLAELDPEAVIELNFNMGHNEFKVYTNSDEAAAIFTSKFCS